MKFTDVLAKVLWDSGVRCVFGLQGGAVVHIFDSLEKHGFDVTYTQHEQTAGFASSTYARLNGIGCCVTTTGPGSTNALTALLGAWQDSLPCCFISGQVRSAHVSYGKKIRQFGTQESPIVDIVKPISKHTYYVEEPELFHSKFIQALEIAKSGRPGPVWIDIPLEHQWAEIPYQPFMKDKDRTFIHADENSYEKFFNLVENARRPLLVLGNGIHLSRCEQEVRQFVKKQRLPYVTTWTAMDLFPTYHEFNLGVIGMSGQKGANKAVFDSDLLICLGTHLSIPHTTTLYDNYAPNAKKVLVNIDSDQIENLNVRFDLIIHSDIRCFFERLENFSIDVTKFDSLNQHQYKCDNWRKIESNGFIDSNEWNRRLTNRSPEKSCFVVDGGGTALYAGFQSSIIKSINQRIICLSGISSMGTGLAETIGAFKTNMFEKYFCIIGDCSFFMNIQDLQTIRSLNIPVIVSVINNNGQLAIRHTQKSFQESRFYGTHPEWGLSNPSIKMTTLAFGIRYKLIDDPTLLDEIIEEVMECQEPLVCEVITSEDQTTLFSQKYIQKGPNQFSPSNLSDMVP